jgi:arylsulfatase
MLNQPMSSPMMKMIFGFCCCCCAEAGTLTIAVMVHNATPNLDRLASEGMMFTDYYAEASCTAGRANFITGELPIRTGLTTVGQAGSPLGMPDEAPTIATVLKSMGYATGQFGKNHLGDRNQFLPTLHGFDEFSVTCIT